MNNAEKPAVPQIVSQMRITAMSDGNISVTGFPACGVTNDISSNTSLLYLIL